MDVTTLACQRATAAQGVYDLSRPHHQHL